MMPNNLTALFLLKEFEKPPLSSKTGTSKGTDGGPIAIKAASTYLTQIPPSLR